MVMAPVPMTCEKCPPDTVSSAAKKATTTAAAGSCIRDRLRHIPATVAVTMVAVLLLLVTVVGSSSSSSSSSGAAAADNSGNSWLFGGGVGAVDSSVIDSLVRLGHLMPAAASAAAATAATENHDSNSSNSNVVYSSALLDGRHLQRAIRQFQKYAALPQTGVVDERTRLQFGKPRCGRPDVENIEMVPEQRDRRRKRRRRRRYATIGNGWPANRVTWSLDRMVQKIDSETVRQIVKDAMRIWETSGMLRFKFQPYQNGDIRIAFHRRNHNDGYTFDGAGGVLAHAFYPGQGIGGDVHFDDEEEWTVGYSDNGPDLYSTAIHEIGHALGLAHSSRQDAVMFPYYQKIQRGGKLPHDDMLGIRRLYRKRPPTSTPTIVTRFKSNRFVPPPPDPCDSAIDAASVIHGDTFVFTGKYYWRISRFTGLPSPPELISRFWYGLPKNLERIDAIYTRIHDGKIVIFSGRQYWVFYNNEAESGYPQPLTRLGLDDYVDHIDAAFIWSHNQQTYLFGGDRYWRFDETRARVMSDYPRPLHVWAGVPANVSAALQQRGVTYFVSGRHYWQFDDRHMRVTSTVGSSAGVKWLGCKQQRQQRRRQQYGWSDQVKHEAIKSTATSQKASRSYSQALMSIILVHLVIYGR